jgi:hypothetical protein
MWPFLGNGSSAFVLALYLATLAIHAVFIGYVVAGTAFALLRPADPQAAVVRDRLPFMLGCGITAGVAPLLFLQLLHQRRFYTANLLMGPRWMMVVPLLIVGFYALYAAKSWQKWRRAALATGLVCFALVAWSWSELHQLMQADAVWREIYAAGTRVYLSGSIVPRFVLFGGAMATTFAMVSAWSCSGDDRKRLARIAVVSRLVSIGAAIWLWQTGYPVDGPARAWGFVLAAATIVEVGAWIGVLRSPSDRMLALATGAGTSAILAAVIVREAPRIALIEPTHELAASADGTLVFVVSFVAATAAIAWVVRTVRS